MNSFDDNFFYGKLINRFLKKGRRDFLIKTFNAVFLRLKQDGLVLNSNELIVVILDILRPLVDLKPRFSSGLIYMLPTPVSLNRQTSLALTWFYKGVLAREDINLEDKIYKELCDLLLKNGNANSYKMKIEFYKQVKSGRVILSRFKRLVF